MWTKKYKECLNCNTQRIRHKSNGYCLKCHPLIYKLKIANSWNFNNKQSLETFPMDVIHLKEVKFEKMKKVFIKQLENRLDYIKIREHKIKAHEIEGIDLEYGFNRLACLCNPKNKSLFHGYANIFDHNFTAEQKIIMFRIIDEIESSVPVKIFDFFEAIKA